jgi:hypothetical protein
VSQNVISMNHDTEKSKCGIHVCASVSSGTLRYMISYMISEVYDIKRISYDIDVYDIIRL